MAKHVVETALLDAELKQHDVSFAQYLGAVKDRVPAGVSVGIMDSIDELLGVGRYLEQGYLRIKLKIEPGWSLEPVRIVREAFGPDILLQTDANTAYTLADARHLAKLDKADLLTTEQPLPEDDIRGHAELAKVVSTPVMRTRNRLPPYDAATAIALGAAPSSTSSRPGSAVTWRPAASTTSLVPAGSVWSAGCWKPASAGPPTWHWPRYPASRCPVTRRHRTATTRRT